MKAGVRFKRLERLGLPPGASQIAHHEKCRRIGRSALLDGCRRRALVVFQRELELPFGFELVGAGNLAKLEPSKGSMRGKLKRAGWKDDYLATLLAGFGRVEVR